MCMCWYISRLKFYPVFYYKQNALKNEENNSINDCSNCIY